MKVVFLFLLVFPAFCFADCNDFGISIFPKSKFITSDTKFIITGYLRGQAVILQLNKKHDVYLTDGIDTISMVISETNVGAKGVTQAVLIAKTKLRTSHFYKLIIADVYKGFLPNPDGEGCQDFHSSIYEAVDANPTNKFRNSKVRIRGQLDEEFGCGPASNIIFTHQIPDALPFIVKATVVDKRENTTKIFYEENFEGKIYLGYGMCSGAFVFAQDAAYAVTFEFWDHNGHLIYASPTPLEFVPKDLVALK